MGRKRIQIGVPGVLRVVAARVINARCLEEETAFWGSRAEGCYIGPCNAKERAVAASIGIVKRKESSLLVPAEVFRFLDDNAFHGLSAR
jgi:hypothetical protein